MGDSYQNSPRCFAHIAFCGCSVTLFGTCEHVREKHIHEALLDSSQSSSMRARGRSANRVPPRMAAASIQLKRCLNLRFAFFSAISGSTPRNLATFTAVNSKSPTSLLKFCRRSRLLLQVCYSSRRGQIFVRQKSLNLMLFFDKLLKDRLKIVPVEPHM